MSKLRQFGHKCRDCQQVVPSGARVCPNCKAFQDWRRFVAVGQTNLALLTAIVSVATTFLAVGIPFFKQHGYRIELFLDSASESELSVAVRNKGDEAVNLRLRMLRVGNSDFNPFSFVGASKYFEVLLDHTGVYVEPGREEKLVARFKSQVSAPLCEYVQQQPFFDGLKEIKDRLGTVGEAQASAYDKVACALGLHETSFNSSREFYFRSFDCSTFEILASCMTTEMQKAFDKKN